MCVFHSDWRSLCCVVCAPPNANPLTLSSCGAVRAQWRASRQMGVVFSEPLLSNGRVTGRLEGVVSLAGAVEAHREDRAVRVGHAEHGVFGHGDRL